LLASIIYYIISLFSACNLLYDGIILITYFFFFRLLPNQNGTIQKQALHCILAWRAPELVPYRDHLENIIPETKYRDALALFGYFGDEPIIKPDHRKAVVDVMVKLLWPKISSLKEVCCTFLSLSMLHFPIMELFCIFINLFILTSPQKELSLSSGFLD
jgi:Down-regulated in metastasis